MGKREFADLKLTNIKNQSKTKKKNKKKNQSKANNQTNQRSCKPMKEPTDT
jgi:hypothetical protein